MKKNWYKVEYLTTLEPPKPKSKKIEDILGSIDDRYYPKGIKGKSFLVDDLKVFNLKTKR